MYANKFFVDNKFIYLLYCGDTVGTSTRLYEYDMLIRQNIITRRMKMELQKIYKTKLLKKNFLT